MDVERLRIGAKARVRFDAYPDLELPAHVYSVGGIPKTGGVRANWVKEIPVRFKLEGIDPRVIPDLSVSVDVILETDDQAVVVPLSGVFQDGGGKPYVYVRSGANGQQWERREVDLGLRSFTHVAVRSGVKPSDVIALDRPPDKQYSVPDQTT